MCFCLQVCLLPEITPAIQESPLPYADKIPVKDWCFEGKIHPAHYRLACGPKPFLIHGTIMIMAGMIGVKGAWTLKWTQEPPRLTRTDARLYPGTLIIACSKTTISLWGCVFNRCIIYVTMEKVATDPYQGRVLAFSYTSILLTLQVVANASPSICRYIILQCAQSLFLINKKFTYNLCTQILLDLQKIEMCIPNLCYNIVAIPV